MIKRDKSEVKPGDIVYIYHMFGYPEMRDREGIVLNVTNTFVYGTWGDVFLHYTDDWEIIG